MLTQKRRLELDEDPVAGAQRTIELLKLREAPVTTDVAFETSRMVLARSDPSDRLIAAICEDLRSDPGYCR